MKEIKVGQRVNEKLANGNKKTGTIVYVNRPHRFYTVQFTGRRSGANYCEAFKF